jgi:hypothetical protein
VPLSAQNEITSYPFSPLIALQEKPAFAAGDAVKNNGISIAR